MAAVAASSRFEMVAKGDTARGHGWTITGDFEGGNGEDVAVSSGSSGGWRPEADPGDDFNGGAYYTCCRVTNERDTARSITVDIRAHHEPQWKGWSMALGPPLILIAEEADGADVAAWRQVPAAEMETSADVLRATVEVPAGRSVYVSNFYWYPTSRVLARLAAIAAARAGDVRPFVAGRSAQGRSIAGLRLPALSSGGPKRPRVVLTGTTQPSEGGQLPCLWILEHLLSPSGAGVSGACHSRAGALPGGAAGWRMTSRTRTDVRAQQNTTARRKRAAAQPRR